MINFKQARKKLSKTFTGVAGASSSIDDLAKGISILGASTGEPNFTSVGLITSACAKAAKGASSLLARLTDKEGSVEQAEDMEIIFHLVCQQSFFRTLQKHIENTPYSHASNISIDSLKLQGAKLASLSTSLSGGYIELSEDGALFAAYGERVKTLLRAIYPAHIGIDDEASRLIKEAIQLVKVASSRHPALRYHFQMESHLDIQLQVRELKKFMENPEFQMSGTSEGAAVETVGSSLPSLHTRNVSDAEAKLAEVYRVLSVNPEVGSEALAELESISESIRKQFEAARNHLELGNLARAETVFRSVEKLLNRLSEPENIELRARSIANLGLIYYRRGKTRRARGYFRFSYRLHPDHPNIRNLRALSLHIEGHTDDAISFLEGEINKPAPARGSQQLYAQLLADSGETKLALEYIEGLASDDLEWVEIRARILMTMEQYSDARSILERVSDDQLTFEMKEQLAYCLAFPLVDRNHGPLRILQEQDKRDLDQAIELLEEPRRRYQVQGNQPAELQVQINIAVFQSRGGNLEGARQTLNAALAHSPNSSEALENRFIVLQKLGLHEEARNDAGALFSIEESTHSAARFAEALLCLDQFRPALKFIAECEESLLGAGDHLSLQCCKLQALQARHERNQAENHAIWIEERFAQSAFALHILARYYSSIKKDEKAEQLFCASIESAQEAEKVAITHDFGLHYYQRGNWSRALEHLTQHNTEPTKSPLFGEVLHCYYELRDFERIIILCKGIEETELSPLSQNIYANTLLELSELGKAAEVLECLIDTTRRSNYRVTLAQVYHRLGKLERSENLLQDAFNDDSDNLNTLIQLSQVAYQLGLHQQGFDLGVRAYEIDPTSVNAMSCVCQVTFLSAEDVDLGNHELKILDECREKHPGIQKIRFKEDEGGKIDPTPIMEMAREQHERMLEILKGYNENRAPMLTLVEATGRDYWSIWRGLTKQRDCKIYMCSGTHDEQDDQIKIAMEAPEVVMDSTSILTAYGLGILDLANDCFKKIYVPIVTLDELRDSYNQLKQFMGSTGGGTLIPVDDSFVLVEDTPGRIEEEAQQLESILAFLGGSSVEIVGLDPDYLRKREEEEPWKSLPDSAFFCFAVSHSKGAPLWSDQMAIVHIHKSLDKGKGFCTRAFLARAREEGHIDSDQLDDALLWLLENNYTFVAEHASTLPRYADRSDYAISDFGRLLIQRIGDESWNNESCSRIYGAAFARLWVSCPRAKRSDWVDAVVVALAGVSDEESVLMNFVTGILLELMHRPSQYFGLLNMLILTSKTYADLSCQFRALLSVTVGVVNKLDPQRLFLMPAALADWNHQLRVQTRLEAI